MIHPNDETLLRYRFDTLDPAETKDVADHLRTCTGCAGRFAALGKGVEKLAAFDAEAELDPKVVEQAMEKVRAARDARPVRPEEPAPAPAPRPGPADRPARVAGIAPDEDEQASEPRLGFLQWLGFAPGAPFREARRYASLALLGGAVALGLGEAYVGAREVKVYTVVRGDKTFPAGARAFTHVQVIDAQSGQGREGASVDVRLVVDGKEHGAFEGKTGPRGVAAVFFDVPDLETQHAKLLVRTTARGEADELTETVALVRDHKVHLSTDKPLYQPGQTIHVRALALDSPSLKPAKDREVALELYDPKGNRLSAKAVKASRFGVVAWDVELANEVPLGAYLVKAAVGRARAEAEVKVARYALPKFKVAVKGSQDSFLAGETLKADLRARYFFGKPVERAEVHAVLVRQDGAVVGDEFKGKTDADGDLSLSFELPAGLASPGEPETLSLQLEVKDAAGQQEQKTQAFVVARELLSVEVLADQGSLLRKLPSRLFVLTTTPEGRPVPCEVTVVPSRGKDVTLRTAENGVGQLDVSAADVEGYTRLEVTASGPDGRRAKRVVTLPSRDLLFNAFTERALYRPGEPVNLTLHARPGAAGSVTVTAFREGRAVLAQEATLADRAQVALELPEGLTGSVELELAMPGAGPSLVRRVIVADPAGLSVQMSSDAEVHAPGAAAKLKFEVKDAAGKPKVAALGLSVVDESLWALTASTAAQARAFFLLERSLLAPRGSLSAAGLLASRSYSEADQLAARALLSAAGGAVVREAAFETQNHAAKRQALAAQKRAWHAFSGVATWVLGLALALAVLAALVRFAAGAFLPITLVVGGVALLVVVPWQARDEVFLLSIAAFILIGIAVSVSKRRIAWSFVAVPLLLIGLVVFFGDNIRRLFGMSADALGGDTVAMAPRAALSNKTMKSFGANNTYGGGGRGMFEADEAPFAPVPSPAPPGLAGQAKAEAAAEPAAAAGPAGAGPAEPPRREVRVRQSFPETMYVHPELVTDEAGVATLELPLADSITDWRVSALASGADGALGTMDAPLRVFQDFFVDLDAPAALVRGDQATLPIAVHNYLTTFQTVRLEVKPEDWFEVVGPQTFSLALAGGEVGGRDVRIKVKKAGRHTLTLRADGTRLSDAVARPMLVSAAGQQKTAVVSGTLKPGELTRVALTVPEGAVQGSTSMMLKVFPSALASAIDGLEGSLRAPHGCFEQTSSTTYPNVLIWSYLKRTGKKSPAVEERAREYVALGYQRLLSFEVAGGGFEWFGRAPANQVLTAYGLMEFKDMAQVFPVDEKLLERTQAWLVSRQQADGSWSPDARSLSDGLWKSGFSGRLMVTAYVTWALVESGYAGNALGSALAYLASHLDEVNDAYTLSVMAATFGKAGHAAAEAATRKLLRLVQRDEKQGLAWFAPSEATIYYGRGVGGMVENTALAAYALMIRKQEPELVKSLLAYLAANRSGSGAWPSTQGTVLALRALLLAAGAEQKDEEVAVTVNGADAGKLLLKASAEQPALVDLAGNAKTGLNVVEITGKSEAQFQVIAVYTQAWREEGAVDAEPLSLKVEYGRTKAALGAIVPLDLEVTYRAPEASGMVVVSLGVPAGLSPLTEDLQELVAAGKLGKFELSPEGVNLYFDQLAPKKAVRLSLRLKARQKVDTQGVGSLAYLYYHPAVRAVSPAVAVTVN